MVLPLVAWSDGLPCPWTRGTMDAVACRESTRGQAVEPTKSACMKVAGRRPAQLPGWLVERPRLGSGMPAPSGRLPPPWAW
jgi:hypothetical protein